MVCNAQGRKINETFEETALAMRHSPLAMLAGAATPTNVKIALVVKSLGNGFFDAANKGAQEAAKELGDVEIIYTGPTTATAEGQIEVINSLIAQKVNAIAISANDADALVPALKKAMERGIKVISWDSGVAKDGRIRCTSTRRRHRADRRDHASSSPPTICRTARRRRHPVGDLDRDQPERLDRGDEEGAAEKFPNINLVATVYGDDQLGQELPTKPRAC